jgi:hypothetical protein
MITFASIAISLTVGFILIQYAHGLIIDDNPTVDRDALIEKLKEIKQYCLDHTDRILAGGNPVQDLINAGMIRQDTFQNMTCQKVDSEILWTELGKGENLKGALGID